MRLREQLLGLQFGLLPDPLRLGAQDLLTCGPLGYQDSPSGGFGLPRPICHDRPVAKSRPIPIPCIEISATIR